MKVLPPHSLLSSGQRDPHRRSTVGGVREDYLSTSPPHVRPCTRTRTDLRRCFTHDVPLQSARLVLCASRVAHYRHRHEASGHFETPDGSCEEGAPRARGCHSASPKQSDMLHSALKMYALRVDRLCANTRVQTDRRAYRRRCTYQHQEYGGVAAHLRVLSSFYEVVHRSTSASIKPTRSHRGGPSGEQGSDDLLTRHKLFTAHTHNYDAEIISIFLSLIYSLEINQSLI